MNKPTRQLMLALALVFSLLIQPGAAATDAKPSLEGPERPPIGLVPGSIPVAAEVEAAVRQALSDAGGVVPAAEAYAITDLTSPADGWFLVSVVGLGGLDGGDSWRLIDNASWFGLALLRQGEVGQWGGAVAGTPAFSRLLALLPETALSQAQRQALDPRAPRPVSNGGYRFPWEYGTSMQYGVLGVHNAGWVPGWKAVDFLSDGNTGAGHAPNRLLAAADGTISYVCRDGTSVAIRVGDLLYVHLLDNGNLNVGHAFAQGDEIAQLRPGEFSNVCGYAWQDPNWFHVHWGFPDTGQFEAGGWTLNLTDELWRRGEETRGIYSWFEAEEGPSCVDATAPDGAFQAGSPAPGGWYTDEVPLQAWANDPGECQSGVDLVRFRAYYDGEWQVVHLDETDCGPGLSCDYGFDWALTAVPTGPIALSLDVQDLAGNWAFATREPVSILKLTDSPPGLTLTQVNSQAVVLAGQTFTSGLTSWRFAGTAADNQAVDHITYLGWGANGLVIDPFAGGTAWDTTRAGLVGHNQVLFYASDDLGQSSPAGGVDRVNLWVDGEPPRTTLAVEGEPGTGGWYQSPVRVWLQSEDGGSGRSGTTLGIPNHYASGIEAISYTVDGGAWQRYAGPFWVSGDGLHPIAYRAADRVGNIEPIGYAMVKIDGTPPGEPFGAAEGHGAISGQWQATVADPAFSWSAASDAASGVAGYEVYWGQDPEGIGATWRGEPTLDPAPVGTGTTYLRARARDHAGNWGSWADLFSFRYDGTPPLSPEVVSQDGALSGVWQSSVRTADMDWETPPDDGAGVAGYRVYWGPSPTMTAGTWVTTTEFISATPICGDQEACTYYLRLQTVDGVGLSAEWLTAFALRFDPGAPPTSTLAPACPAYHITINDGETTTSQRQITLGLCGPDPVKVQLSHRTDFSGSTWLPYTNTMTWTLPISAGSSTPLSVYARFMDANDLVHGTLADQILYDPDPPAATLAVATVDPLTATLHLEAWDGASGVAEMQVGDSPGLVGAVWEPYNVVYAWILPPDDGTENVYARVRDRAANLSEVVSTTFLVDRTPPTGTLGLASPIVGPGTLSVTLAITAQDRLSSISQMRLGYSAAFTATAWVSFSQQITLPWRLADRWPAVYGQFRDAHGNQSAVYSASLTVDTTPPTGTVHVEPGLGNRRLVWVSPSDDQSGVAQVYLSPDPVSGYELERLPFRPRIAWDFARSPLVYVRLVDGVGNAGPWLTAVLYHLEAAYLPLALRLP